MEGCDCFSRGNSLETGKIFADSSFWTPKELAGEALSRTVLYCRKPGKRLNSHAVERPALKKITERL